MKNFKNYLGFLALTALLFTSCSKEEPVPDDPSAKTATLSFATVLNDLVSNKAALKQELADLPDCSDAAPAFVEVVLSGTEAVGTMEDPLVVPVNPTPGNYDDDPEEEYFTEESAELELTPGDYTLEFFAVYDGDPADETSNLIWIAPNEDGSLSNYVDTFLPMDFTLGDGAKKYLDVEVLCFDDRMVNEYGYLFFDFEGTEAIEFCVFGNFCPPSGRHYPAEYTVNVWAWEDGAQGESLFSGSSNVEIDENGDYAGDPVCMALPDREGEDEYYVEITLLSSDAYGDVEERVIRSGVINDEIVRSFFDGENNLDYWHFKEGCVGGEPEIPIFPDPDAAGTYLSCPLFPVNGSGAVAFGYLRVNGDQLTTTILGINMTPGEEHPQHIHGFADDTPSTCPEWDGEDYITLEESVEFVGPAMLALVEEDGTYPVADANGMYLYNRTFTLGAGDIPSLEELGPLEIRAIEVHGMEVDDEYLPTLPVACGEIMPIDLGL